MEKVESALELFDYILSSDNVEAEIESNRSQVYEMLNTMDVESQLQVVEKLLDKLRDINPALKPVIVNSFKTKFLP